MRWDGRTPQRPRTEMRGEVYRFFVAWMEDHAVPPTHRQIQEGLHISSTSVVRYHLDQLYAMGLLEREGVRFILAKGIDHGRSQEH